jgi:hypothetical protein
MLAVGGRMTRGWRPGANSVPGRTGRNGGMIPFSLIDTRSGTDGTAVALIEVVTV